MGNPETRILHLDNKKESYVDYAQNQSNIPEEFIAKVAQEQTKEPKTQNKTIISGSPAHVVIPKQTEKSTPTSAETQQTRTMTKDRSGEKGSKQTAKGEQNKGKYQGTGKGGRTESAEQEYQNQEWKYAPQTTPRRSVSSWTPYQPEESNEHKWYSEQAGRYKYPQEGKWHDYSEGSSANAYYKTVHKGEKENKKEPR